MKKNNYIFSKKLICDICKWKMRGIMDRKNPVYICGKYSLLGKCKRNTIHESYLIEHLKTNNISFETVESIIINQGNIEIKQNTLH